MVFFSICRKLHWAYIYFADRISKSMLYMHVMVLWNQFEREWTNVRYLQKIQWQIATQNFGDIDTILIIPRSIYGFRQYFIAHLTQICGIFPYGNITDGTLLPSGIIFRRNRAVRGAVLIYWKLILRLIHCSVHSSYIVPLNLEYI